MMPCSTTHGGVRQVEPALQQAARGADAAQQDRHRHDGQRIVARQERRPGCRSSRSRRRARRWPCRAPPRPRPCRRARPPRRRQRRPAARSGRHRGPSCARSCGLPPITCMAKPQVVKRWKSPGQQAGDDAEHQAPMHVRAGDGADHVGVADRPGRRLVEARRIAQRPLDEMVHQRDGDVGQQQARDRLVDAAPLAQRAGQRDPERRPRPCRPAPWRAGPRAAARSAAAMPAAAAATPPTPARPRCR